MLRRMLTSLAFAAVAAAGDLAGAVVVTTMHRRGGARLRYFVAAGAGFMLAAAFVRMLPESAHVEHAFLFVLVGYFGVHLFEHTVAPHFHFGEETHHAELLRPSAGYLAVLGLGVHTLFDGVAIAAGFMISTTLGILLFLAVLVVPGHDDGQGGARDPADDRRQQRDAERAPRPEQAAGDEGDDDDAQQRGDEAPSRQQVRDRRNPTRFS